MSHARWLCLAIPIFVGACHTHPKQPAGASTITAASVPSPVAAQADRMPHCPNVVGGAATIVSEVPGGIELRITAGGDGTDEIRKRAAFLSAAAEETRGKHLGTGGGNAQFGRCPIVMRNTKVEVRDVPGGVAVVMRPSLAVELDWLRREVEARSAQLAAPKPFGPGMMMMCPSAVANAETTVTDAPYGVDVKVTAMTAEGTRAIRDRAKELAAHGPGLEERCPATAPEATLVASEVPGGAKIAVKARRPDDVASLRHTVHERAQAYEPPAAR